MVVVKGFTELAKEETACGRSCSTQNVFRAVRRVAREKLKAEGLCKKEWDCVVEAVPKEMLVEVKAHIRKRVDGYKKSKGLKV